MPSTLTEHAARLAENGDVGRGLALLTAAGDQGDGEALFQLAIWFLAGSYVARDLVRAREYLRRAGGAGHHDAAMMLVALVGNGAGTAANWAGALSSLRDLAKRHGDAARQQAMIDAASLDDDGFPAVAPVRETIVPEVLFRFPGFASAAECTHLAEIAAASLTPTMVADPATGRLVPHPVRTSDGALIGPTRESLAVQAINRRIARASGTDIRQGEALTVLRYAPGQQYKTHMDTLPATTNQRVLTMLIYLNDAFRGGETTFPAYGVKVRPRAGDAILFSNTLADLSPDPRSRHAGEPVTSGQKWLATRWIRTRPFDVWTGPENA